MALLLRTSTRTGSGLTKLCRKFLAAGCVTTTVWGNLPEPTECRFAGCAHISGAGRRSGKFGLVVCGPSGHIGGYTIEEVLQIADDMDDCEQSLYDMVGDIAVEAKLIRDLANRIKELEQANAQENTQAETSVASPAG